ncbi:hypothetical protein GCM10027065_03950 [Rhodanobacter koreensis]
MAGTIDAAGRMGDAESSKTGMVQRAPHKAHKTRMMPQAARPQAVGKAAPREYPRDPVQDRQASVMSQCSYTGMTNRLRFVGCDPFRIACHRQRFGGATI